MGDDLATTENILIQQQDECTNCLPFAALGLCYGESKFGIFTCNKEGVQGQKIAVWEEKETGFLSKCLAPCCREHKGQLTSVDNKVKSLIQIPFKCHCPLPCCSLQFPLKCCNCACIIPQNDITKTTVDATVQQGKYTFDGYGGKIEQAFFCYCKGRQRCNIQSLNIRNSDNKLESMIDGNALQASYICKQFRSCGCKDVVFHVKDPQRKIIATIKFVSQDLLTDCLTKNSRIIINFEQELELQKRIRVIHSVMNLKFYNFLG